jgi:hypothetical protein
MSPAEAARLLETARSDSSSGPALRVVAGTDVSLTDHPGRYLQRRRQQLGLSDVQVAEALRLRRENVEFVETMQFERLHGLGYALGFVRAYAELVSTGIGSNKEVSAEVEAIVDAFRARWEPVQLENERKARRFDPGRMLPFGAFALLALVMWLAVTAVIHTLTPREEEVIGPPDQVIRQWTGEGAAAPGRAVASVEPLVTIHALRPARITLRGEDGALVADRYLRQGEAISADGLGRFFITSPDAGAIEVRGYGQTVSLGADGEKADWWRVPDLEALEKARIEALKQEELAKAEPAKSASVN